MWFGMAFNTLALVDCHVLAEASNTTTRTSRWYRNLPIFISAICLLWFARISNVLGIGCFGLEKSSKSKIASPGRNLSFLSRQSGPATVVCSPLHPDCLVRRRQWPRCFIRCHICSPAYQESCVPGDRNIKDSRIPFPGTYIVPSWHCAFAPFAVPCSKAWWQAGDPSAQMPACSSIRMQYQSLFCNIPLFLNIRDWDLKRGEARGVELDKFDCSDFLQWISTSFCNGFQPQTTMHCNPWTMKSTLLLSSSPLSLGLNQPWMLYGGLFQGCS